MLFNSETGTVHERMYSHFCGLIRSGAYEPGRQMPAVRQVAKEHGINPNTVQKVYKMLEQNGLIYTVPQKGSYVKDEGAVNAIREAVKEFGEAVDTALKKNVTPEQMRNVIEERCENND